MLEITANVAELTKYCQQWRLKLSCSKIFSSVLPLRNTCTHRQVDVSMFLWMVYDATWPSACISRHHRGQDTVI